MFASIDMLDFGDRTTAAARLLAVFEKIMAILVVDRPTRNYRLLELRRRILDSTDENGTFTLCQVNCT